VAMLRISPNGEQSRGLRQRQRPCRVGRRHFPRTVAYHAVRLHPAIVIFALLSGGAVFGLLGIVLAVPIAATMRLVLIYIRAKLQDADPFAPLTEDLAATHDDAPEHLDTAAVPSRLRAQP